MQSVGSPTLQTRTGNYEQAQGFHSTPPPKPPRQIPDENVLLSPEDLDKSRYDHLRNFRPPQIETNNMYETLAPAQPLSPPLPPPPSPLLPPPLPRPIPRPPRKDKLQIKMYGANNVIPLTEKNYNTFITGKEKVLVIFYDGEDISSSAITAEFGLAAASSPNSRHGFGSVDCAANLALCCRKSLDNLPLLKLFSNGFEVSTLRTLHKFNSDQMKMLITMAPVLTQPRADRRLR